MLASNIPVLKPMLKETYPEELNMLIENPELLRIMFDDFSDTEVRRFCIANKKIYDLCKRDVVLKKRLEKIYRKILAVDLKLGQEAIAYINQKGELFVLGNDISGRLALGSIGQSKKRQGVIKYIPKKITTPKVKRFRSVQLFNRNMACITDKGKLYMSGSGTWNKLQKKDHDSDSRILIPIGKGTPLWDEYVAEVIVENKNVFALTENGRIWVWGRHFPNPTPINIPEKVVQITKNRYLTEDGKIYSYRIGDSIIFEVEEVIQQNWYQWLLYEDERDPAKQVSLHKSPENYWTIVLTRSNRIVLIEITTEKEERPIPILEELTLMLPPDVQPVVLDTSSFLVVIGENGNIYYWFIESAMRQWVIGKVPEETYYIESDDLPSPVKSIITKDIIEADNTRPLSEIFLILNNEDIYNLTVGPNYNKALTPFIQDNIMYYRGMEYKL
jgi:hypothetical protein